MVHQSMRNLKLDRRLARRRGWLESGEYEEALDALPDAAEKGETVPSDEGQAPREEPTSEKAPSGLPGV